MIDTINPTASIVLMVVKDRRYPPMRLPKTAPTVVADVVYACPFNIWLL